MGGGDRAEIGFNMQNKRGNKAGEMWEFRVQSITTHLSGKVWKVGKGLLIVETPGSLTQTGG